MKNQNIWSSGSAFLWGVKKSLISITCIAYLYDNVFSNFKDIYCFGVMFTSYNHLYCNYNWAYSYVVPSGIEQKKESDEYKTDVHGNCVTLYIPHRDHHETDHIGVVSFVTSYITRRTSYVHRVWTLLSFLNTGTTMTLTILEWSRLSYITRRNSYVHLVWKIKKSFVTLVHP